MANKAIIVILVILLIVGGGLGYYSYRLNEQIDYLGKQLTAFQQEQANRIDTVSNDLITFKGETALKTSDLENKMGETITKIDNLEGDITHEIASTKASIDTLATELNKTTSQVDTLENEMIDVSNISQSVINANEVYQKVSQATVRISDGESNIGSGFILDDDAHVLTAYHVVENLDNIYITLADGRVSTATNIGSSSQSDIAVLKLTYNPGIEPPPLADSSKLRIGEPVVAIGNPFDLTETITAGIVSQTERFVEIEGNSGSRWVANLIQFDAAANYGNSGCPLINANGEVIGVVVARVDPNQGDGIYYAVSSNKVKKVSTDLITQGFYDYPRLGINVTDLTPQMVMEWNLETANGALVRSVLTGTPAEAAGVQIDDIVVAMDRVTVKDVASLISYLGEHKSPGEETTLTLIRGGTRMDVSLTVGSQPR